MLGGHGMQHAAHGDAVATLNLLHDGHVLLLGTIGGVLFEQLHRLAAAYGHSALFQNLYHATAVLTNINFSFFSHNAFVF